MSISCYVYYRVAPAQASEAATAARDTIERIRQCTGITGQLMTKVGEPLLWMEVYEDIEDTAAFLEAMRRCVEGSAINRWLDGDRRRHTEMFKAARPPRELLPGDVT